MEKIIIDTLNEIDDNNDYSIILPKDAEYKDRLSNSIKVIEFNSMNERFNIFLYFEIYNYMKNYDIVHTHGAKASKITYYLNKFLPFIHIATKHNIRKGKIFNKIKNVISVSEEVAKTITHPSKVLYFGIKNNTYIKCNKNDIFTIVAVGRLDLIKGFDLLIKEISKLSFDFKLNIIGDGPQKEKLEKLIIDYNLENRVFLLGFKSNISEYLANSHLQVISSLSEGMPLILLEGLMSSSVIISTPVGGIPEALHQSYLVDIDKFSDKIADIYKNYSFYSDDFYLKHNDLKEKFDFKNYANELTHYYKRCIDG